MKHMLIFLTVLLSFSLQPTITLAAMDDAPIDLPENLTDREMRILFRVCDRTDDRSKMRCYVRQLQKMGYDGSRTLPTGAYEVYTELDQTRVRNMKNAKQRILSRVEERLHERRNYNNPTPIDDINTQRLDYVKDIRMEHLRCMRDVPPGRPRSLCLDQLKSDARQDYRIHANRRAEELQRKWKAGE